KRFEWIQSTGALGAEVAGVGITDPPHERGRGFWITGVEPVLEFGHDLERVIGRDVGVDHAVPPAGDRIGLEYLGITVHHPIDRPVTNGVYAHMESGVVVHPDQAA